MSFGGETIDNLGVTRSFPSLSMLTGLFANALGLRRVDREAHQRLQDRLVFAARIDREPAGGTRLRDFQTVQLRANDRGWTTHGVPQGRTGGAATYDSSHLRYRDYFADMRVTVALRLEPDDEPPTLERLTEALYEPARPLFIGRKPCLPSTPIAGPFVDGSTVMSALVSTPLASTEDAPESVRVSWPDGEGCPGVLDYQTYLLTDERNWVSGLHGGGRRVCEGSVPRSRFPQPCCGGVGEM